MNKLKALLIAGLLSLSSVSFATSVTFVNSAIGGVEQTNALNEAGTTADTEKAGTIYLDDYGTAVFGGDFGGVKDVSASVWYELNINFSTGADTIGLIGNTAGSNPSLTSTIYEWDSALSDYKSTALYAGLGLNFVVDLVEGKYKLLLEGEGLKHYDGELSAVPVPAAGILFASALLGAGALGRRKKKAQASVVGAFARVS